jgi:hypothetical protein
VVTPVKVAPAAWVELRAAVPAVRPVATAVAQARATRAAPVEWLVTRALAARLAPRALAARLARPARPGTRVALAASRQAGPAAAPIRS